MRCPVRFGASTAVLAPVVRRYAGHKQARTPPPAWHARPEAVELRWAALESHANGAHFAEHTRPGGRQRKPVAEDAQPATTRVFLS